MTDKNWRPVDGSKVFFQTVNTEKCRVDMTKEVYQVTTTNGGTFQIICNAMFDDVHYLRLREAMKNNINSALGLKLVKSIKYIGKAVEVK